MTVYDNREAVRGSRSGRLTRAGCWARCCKLPSGPASGAGLFALPPKSSNPTR